MIYSLLTTNSVIIISIIGLIILSIIPYVMAKNSYDYNIYNLGNLGYLFGGGVLSYLIMVFTSNNEDPTTFLLLISIVIFLTILIVFLRTVRNTNVLIALLAIIPQLLITLIIYLVTKTIYNKLFKEDY